MDQDFEQLRESWRTLNVPSDRLESDNRRIARQLAAGKAVSAQRRLSKYYKRTAYIALCLPVLSLFLAEIGFPMGVVVAYALYGVIMAVMHFMFSRKIMESNYLSLPVAESLRHALRIQSRQRILRFCSIVACVPLLIAMFMFAFDSFDESMLWAMGIGLVLGIVIGLIKFFKILSITRRMRQELQSMQEEN